MNYLLWIDSLIDAGEYLKFSTYTMEFADAVGSNISHEEFLAYHELYMDYMYI